MIITTQQFEDKIELQIVSSAIISTEFLSEIQKHYSKNYLVSPYAQIILDWCMEYHKKHNEAPQNYINDIYLTHCSDSNVHEHIKEYLDKASFVFKNDGNYNYAYFAEKAVAYFRKRNTELFIERVTSNLKNNNILKAEEIASTFKHIELEENYDEIDPFRNSEAVKQAFNDIKTPIFSFEGVFGKMINPQLYRSSFIAIQAREKQGKSWFLMEFALRALFSKCNVVFFQAGDMSRNQMLRRIAGRVTQSPIDKYSTGEFYVPVDFSYTGNKDSVVPFYDIIYKTVRFDNELLDYEASQSLTNFSSCIPDNSLKLCTYPNNTLTVKEIENRLEAWEMNENWTADVIVIDYADIMNLSSKMEYRHQVNELWKQLRALSQKKNVVLITATQTDASTYNDQDQTLKSFSEDKRKYAHVTACLALNQTAVEKENGVIRAGWLLLREGYFSMANQVTILQSLRTCRPLIKSIRPYEIKENTETIPKDDF